MRSINKTFNIIEEVENTKIATSEAIVTITEDKENRVVGVGVAYKDGNGNTIGSDTYNIFAENYDLLMSDSPEFAPNKPLNEYREEDLWFIIDKIRSGQTAT